MPTPPPLGQLDHHFLEGQQRYIERVDEVVTLKNWWRRACFCAMGLSAVLVLGCLYLGSLPKQIPYVIDRDASTGAMWAAGIAKGWDLAPEATLRYWLREFVQCLREIQPAEGKEATKDLWTRTKYRVTPKGRKLFLAYEKEWKPLQQREPTTIQITHIFRRKANMYAVRWIETRYSGDSKRELLSTTAYLGEFTFEQRKPVTPEELDNNPAGIFFDFWQWSADK